MYNHAHEIWVKPEIERRRVAGAHLHRGEAGSNGDVIADLLIGSELSPAGQGTVITGSIADSRLSGPLKGQSTENLIKLIKENRVYVNLHTPTNADGEIRGTLHTVGAQSQFIYADSPSDKKASASEAAILHVFVKDASPEAGLVQIGAFGVTADQENTKFDENTRVDVGALAERQHEDTFEVANFKFRLDDVPIGGYINACFDATSKPKSFQGGCNYIELKSAQESYSISLDMKGFEQ